MPHTIFPKAKLRKQTFSSLTVVNPQWLGGGELKTYQGAERIASFLSEAIPYAENPVETGMLTGKEAAERTAKEAKACYQLLSEYGPDRVFTVGGSEDADIPALAYLNRKVSDDFALVILSPRSLVAKEPSGNPGRKDLLPILTGKRVPEGFLNAGIAPGRILRAGGDAFSPEETEALKQAGIRSILRTEDVFGGISDWLEEKKFQRVYLHLSLDALDLKAFTKGQTALPKGITWPVLRDTLDFLRTAYDFAGIGIFESAPEDIQDTHIMELAEFGAVTTGISIG